MSALETTVRVNSEKQTLILAGEPLPRQSLTESISRRFAYTAAASPRPLTILATPIDEPMLIDLVPSYTSFAERSSAPHAVDAYARTQQLAVGNARTSIIDTYA
jgi:hypothetical protein